MNTSNYYENEERKNEIRIEHDELALDQFILNDVKNKNSQVLFHEALKTLIDKYNTLNEEKRREEGIFYLKDDNILLGNITEEIVQAYNNYKALFDNLMAGKSMFFENSIQNQIKSVIKLFQKIIITIIEMLVSYSIA